MHYSHRKFWQSYEKLPKHIQNLADSCYELLKKNPSHPSLHLKKVGKYWSVRIGKNHRALGVEVEGGILWFWIGNHSEYEQLIES